MTTAKEIRDKAADEATPINRLINANDINDEAESWDEVGTDELYDALIESAEVIQSERQSPFAWYAHDLTMELTRDALIRAPMGDLSFETHEEAVKAGYWPHKVNNVEIEEYIQELNPDYDDTLHHIWTESKQEAWDTVTAGIIDGMQPEIDS